MKASASLFIGTLCSGVLFAALTSPVTSSTRNPTLPLAAAQGSAAAPDGAALYRQKCAMCHDQPVERAPARSALASRSPETLITALTAGVNAFTGGSATVLAEG